MRAMPDIAVDLAKRHEGFHKRVRRGTEISAVPYICPAGFWTIGYGHLCAQDHPAITEEVGEFFLSVDLEDALAGALRLCPVLLVESEARLAAIVDFVFNLGAGRLAASTLRRRVNARNWRGAADEIQRWVWGGGQKLPGLILRRAEEARLLVGDAWAG